MVFEKEYIMRCSSSDWIARNGCALRWCHRGVGRLTEETVQIPEWTAQFCVWKTTGKDSSEVCAIVRQNNAVYTVFPSGMTSHSKIAQFNWQRIARLTPAHGLGHPISRSQSEHEKTCINCLSPSGGRGFPGCCLFKVDTAPVTILEDMCGVVTLIQTDSANNGNPFVQVGAVLVIGVLPSNILISKLKNS